MKIGLAAALFMLVCSVQAQTTSNSVGTGTAVLTGAYIGDPMNSQGQMQSFSSAVQPPAVLDTYIDITLPESQWVQSAQYAAQGMTAEQGVTPMVGLPMASTGEDADTSFKNIINGSEDAIFNGIFSAFKNAGYSGIAVRPGFEFNGNWMPWSVTASNAADFVAAFQRIASLAHAMTGQGMLINVVWNPNVGNAAVPWAQLYPGDAYVDSIGPDIYGTPIGGPAPGDAGDANTVTVINLTAFAKTRGKTFVIPETGSADVGFVGQLQTALVNANANTTIVAIWDSNDACGGCGFSAGDPRAAAWQALFTALRALSPSAPASASANATVLPYITAPPDPNSAAAQAQVSAIPLDSPDTASLTAPVTTTPVDTTSAPVPASTPASPGTVAATASVTTSGASPWRHWRHHRDEAVSTPAVSSPAAAAPATDPLTSAAAATPPVPVVINPTITELVTGEELVLQAEAAVQQGAAPATSDALIAKAIAALNASIAQSQGAAQ